jgi:hypothetical protein
MKKAASRAGCSPAPGRRAAARATGATSRRSRVATKAARFSIAGAAARDPSYECRPIRRPRTACSYVVVARPPALESREMYFWSLRFESRRIVAFCAPIGETSASFGCSHDPELRLDFTDVMRIGLGIGLKLKATGGFFEARPRIVARRATMGGAAAIGEARESSCSLTDYGVLAALSHVLAFKGAAPLPPECLRRARHDAIDPHLPTELVT